MKQTLEEAASKELFSSYACTSRTLSFTGFLYNADAMLNMFRKGAEWHAKQSPWISVKQYPPIDKPLLLKYGDGGIDDMDLGFYTGLHYINKNGQQVDEHIVGYMLIPSFDEILEANRDVLERIKEKGD